jgi:selenide,water dikinase
VILEKMPRPEAESILVGVETRDDACVYLVRDGLALVQTVDFFTPIVNDPYLFGKITAANALSDIYAMGGEPALALSLVGFPCSLGMDVLAEIVRGGNEVMSEAGVLVLGGHSVDDEEPKYGFAVTGFMDPADVKRNSTAREGDWLYLTKRLGTGILATAIKADMISEDDVMDQLEIAMRLNRAAKNAAIAAHATALTDVTGFGLVGHAHEMAAGAGLAVELFARSVPIDERALEFASMGVMPAGLHDNKRYVEGLFEVEEGVDQTTVDLLFDPQTSGGLLIAVAPENRETLEEELKKHGEPVHCVGRFIAGRAGAVAIRSAGA